MIPIVPRITPRIMTEEEFYGLYKKKRRPLRSEAETCKEGCKKEYIFPKNRNFKRVVLEIVKGFHDQSLEHIRSVFVSRQI